MATGSNTKKEKATKRRNRVNRIKTFIIFIAVLLLVASVCLNFVLLFKVLHLEEQMNQLYSVNYFFNNILS